MITDAIFYGQYFFVDLPVYSSGTINPQIDWPVLTVRLASSERVSIS